MYYLQVCKLLYKISVTIITYVVFCALKVFILKYWIGWDMGQTQAYKQCSWIEVSLFHRNYDASFGDIIFSFY